jgi:hypothetical protein
MKNTLELIYASDYEEFYYKDSDEPVCEGDPVGIEWEELKAVNEPVVHFNLLSNIYWSPKYEAEEEEI